MKKKIFGLLLLASVFIACQPAEEENTSSASSTATPATVTQPASTGTAAATPAAPVTPAQPVMAPPAAPIAGTSPRVNPAHGLPGHRCDLQVGAPLPAEGSASAAQVVPSATATQVLPAAPAGQAGPTVQSIAIPPPPANTGSPVSGSKRVNPAHGQPGHRCDIAVGAPLN